MHQRRRNLIIDKRFQLKFCIFVVFWMLALKFLAPFIPATALIFIAAVATSIFISHRIAGPVYRIQKALERWKTGNVETTLTLRTGDEFQPLADAYNQAAIEHARLRTKLRNTQKFLASLSGDLEPRHRAEIKEIIGEIESGIEKKTT